MKRRIPPSDFINHDCDRVAIKGPLEDKESPDLSSGRMAGVLNGVCSET
jgi:hypothetical protein